MTGYFRFLISLIIVIIVTCCENNQTDVTEKTETAVKDTTTGLTINFRLSVNRNVYIYTNFGEPPQIAIWLEYPDSNFYRTVWVTHRSGKNDWEGKVECKVALPYWNYKRHADQQSGIPSPVVDGLTGATPKNGEFRAKITVPENTVWRYNIEVNASGDYNDNFPYWSDLGMPDSDGNGQPSIIYSGTIIARIGNTSEPKLIGWTDQWSKFSTLHTDLDKITTAKRLVDNLSVEVTQ